MLDLTDGLVVKKLIKTDTLKIIMTGQRKYFISIDPRFERLPIGTRFDQKSDIYRKFLKFYVPQDIMYEYYQENFMQSIGIEFEPDWGYRAKGSKLKKISYSVAVLPIFDSLHRNDIYPDIKNYHLKLIPDEKNYPENQFYDDQGILSPMDHLRNILDSRYYNLKARHLFEKLLPGYSEVKNDYARRMYWTRLYVNTLGYGSHYSLLKDNYARLWEVCQTDKRGYAKFFLFAAGLTILIEILVFLILFKPVTGIALKEKTGLVLLSVVIGTGFTITMLWWVFPKLLHSNARVTIGGEIFALIVESVVYYALLRIKYVHAFFLSLFCNFISYFIGLWLFMFIVFII